MQLNKNIARLRKERGLTQEQLANLLNVSVTAVSKWENGNNMPDIELLPDMADVFQVSVDSLLGYEKAYKHLDKIIVEIENMLKHEKYNEAMERLRDVIKKYPNDFRVNHLLGDTYYSLIVSDFTCKEKYIEKAIFYYERCIELFEERYCEITTIESLEIQIVTLLLWKEKDNYDDALVLIKKHNQSGKYDYLLAQCLFQMGKRDEAKAINLRHCISGQIFVFNDLSRMADMYVQDADYGKAIRFLETEINAYCLFMDKEKGNYADRAYAGKAEIIGDLYKKAGNWNQADRWHKEAVKHAKRYMQNPSMEISSMKYCENVPGRMIDNYQNVIKALALE